MITTLEVYKQLLFTNNAKQGDVFSNPVVVHTSTTSIGSGTTDPGLEIRLIGLTQQNLNKYGWRMREKKPRWNTVCLKILARVWEHPNLAVGELRAKKSRLRSNPTGGTVSYCSCDCARSAIHLSISQKNLWN